MSESWLFHLNSTFPVNCSEISASRNKYRTNYTNTDTGTICPLQSGEDREREEARGTNFQEETNVWFCHFSDKLERENQTLFNCCHDKINQQHNEDFLLFFNFPFPCLPNEVLWPGPLPECDLKKLINKLIVGLSWNN